MGDGGTFSEVARSHLETEQIEFICMLYLINFILKFFQDVAYFLELSKYLWTSFLYHKK
jgi:hypothetical protein